MYCAILYVPYHTQTYDEIVIVLIACYNHIIILICIAMTLPSANSAFSTSSDTDGIVITYRNNESKVIIQFTHNY